LGLTYCTIAPLLEEETVNLSRARECPSNARGATLLSINRKGGANKDISYISEFKGIFFKYPLLSISLAVSLFSMAGIPPLIGFFSKQLVLYSALQNGYNFISVVAIIVSVISCSYYLQIIKLIFSPAIILEGNAISDSEMDTTTLLRRS
jgi:NADH:ubiquinone oxidoreductase subunit 2 (subunit N)